MAYSETYIENEVRYEAGKQRRIAENRRKSGRAKWFAAHEDAQAIYDWLFDQEHALAFYAKGDFLNKIRNTIDEWGGLTDGQHTAVAKSYARAQELEATRNQRREEQAAADRNGSKHVGSVGDRIDLTVTCERNFSYETDFGITYINVCRDADGNIIIYKGTKSLFKGSTYTGKATIKAHSVREGVAQTLIARPKFD